VQKAAGDIIVIKRLVDGVGAQYAGQGQEAAGNAFGQAEKVRFDTGLLAGKQRAGAAKANGNFIGNQMYLILVAQAAQFAR
jgi:hypothetical protein